MLPSDLCQERGELGEGLGWWALDDQTVEEGLAPFTKAAEVHRMGHHLLPTRLRLHGRGWGHI